MVIITRMKDCPKCGAVEIDEQWDHCPCCSFDLEDVDYYEQFDFKPYRRGGRPGEYEDPW